MTSDGPARLGPFRMHELLGEGAHAAVHRGVHVPTARPVAVKVLRAAERGAVRALEREVQAVASLAHPGIIEVYDTGLVPAGLENFVEGTRWIALELATDGSLATARPPRRYPSIRQVLRQVMAALAHAHARGVIHRDLKPANVLMSGRRLKLADFGVAWAAGARQGPRVAGTPAYMAPEQIRGDARLIGPWTDLYALGCLAWELTTGAPPFQGDLEALLAQHQHDEPPVFRPRLHLPSGFEAWLRRLLAKDPRDRGDHAALASAALVDLGTDVVIAHARPLSTDEPPPMTWTESMPLTEEVELPIEGARAPVGDTWRRPRPDWRLSRWERPPVWLLGGSLGLFTLRAVPVVGRFPERDQLWEALCHAATAREVTLLCVHGETGLGTTALGRWLAHAVREEGLGHVVEAGAAPPDAVAGDVAAWHPRGLVMVWVDDPDEALARAWVDWVDEADVAQAMDHVLVLLTRQAPLAGVSGLALRPMRDDAIARLCRQSAGLGSRAARRVSERAAGSPGDAMRMLNALVAEDALVHGAQGFDIAVGADHVLPMGPTERAARLVAEVAAGSGHDLAPVAVAALLDGGVSHGGWRRLCEACGVAADPEPFGPLLEAGVVRWTGRWRFGARATVEGVLAQLPDDEVLRLAGGLADAMAAVFPAGTRTEQRAELYLRAGRVEEALDVLVATPTVSVGPSTRALAQELLDALALPADDPRAVWVVLRALQARRFGHGRMAYEQALTLLEGLVGEARRVALPLVAVLARHANEHDAVLAHLDEAIDHGPSAFLLRRRAIALENLDRMAEAEATAQAALALARATEDVVEEAILMNDLADWDRVHGRIEDAELGFRASLIRADALGLPELQTVTRENLALVLAERGQWSEAHEAMRGVMAWSQERGDGRLLRSTILAMLCLTAAHVNDAAAFEDALVRLEAEPNRRIAAMGLEGVIQLGKASVAIGHPVLARRTRDVMRRAGRDVYELAMEKVQHGFFGPGGAAR